jgi:lipopolysaccharide biosynthesis regulator YciM
LGPRWRGVLHRARGRPAARGDAAAALRAALLCVLDHDWAGAEARLQELVREDSRQIEAYLALAGVFRLRGEIGRAIRVHQNLLLRSDLDAAQRRLALRGLADDYRQGGFLERAADAYEKLLAEAPRDVAALRSALRVHRAAGRPQRALELARRLHRLTGSSAESRREEAALGVELAERAHGEGQADEARRALRRALRRDRSSAAAHALLGELEVERGRSKRALAAWRHALALDRRQAPVLLGKLRSGFAALGRGAEYEPFLRELARSRPEDPEPRLALARLLRERGEAEAASAELRALLAQSPAHLEAQAELGYALAAAGRESEACAAWAALGDALARSGALRPVERAVE